MKRKALAVLISFAILTALAARDVQAISIASRWYLEIRYDAINYSYTNAAAEIADPANLAWIAAKVR